jgi:hypothetical protein
VTPARLFEEGLRVGTRPIDRVDGHTLTARSSTINDV